MTMSAFIFSSLANAQAARVAIDAATNMPLAGVNIGQGPWAPAAQSVTTTYAAIYQNAAGTQWALIADATTTPIAAVHAVSAIPTPIDMGSGGNWAGAVQVWP